MTTDTTPAALADDQIKHMVNRFLAWKLPPDFHPDAGIRFASIYEPSRPGWPIGTNLLTANQAEAMIRHLLDGMPALRAPAGEPVAWLYEIGKTGVRRVYETRFLASAPGWTETPLYTDPTAPGLAEALLWHVEQVCGPLSRDACEVDGDDDYSVLRAAFVAVLCNETPLYAAPTAPDREALREKVAKAICRAYAVRAGADDEAVELQAEYALEFWLDEADAAIAAMNPAAIRAKGKV